MRLLVDTNVFLDFLLKRDPGLTEGARDFFSWCAKHKHGIYVTSMSLRDIEYVAHRFFHNKELAKSIQRATYEMCTKVIGISADSAIESLYNDVDDYEDSLIIESAKEALLDGIVTNNKEDFAKSAFPVFSPREIVDISD